MLTLAKTRKWTTLSRQVSFRWLQPSPNHCGSDARGEKFHFGFRPKLNSLLTRVLVVDSFKHFVWFQELAFAREGD